MIMNVKTSIYSQTVVRRLSVLNNYKGNSITNNAGNNIAIVITSNNMAGGRPNNNSPNDNICGAVTVAETTTTTDDSVKLPLNFTSLRSRCTKLI